MNSPCLLTDNAAQFSQLNFQGKEFLHVLPLDVRFRGTNYPGGKDLKPSDLPLRCKVEDHPGLVMPSILDLANLFINLSQNHSEIICVFHSSHFSPLYSLACSAAENVKGRARIEIFDSQTISAGQGMIIQKAAELLAKKIPFAEVDRSIRSDISHTFSLFSIPGMSYLNHLGYVDEGQAGASEYLGLMPVFAMEAGQLSPIEKLRNQRQTLDFFQEFIEEFGRIRAISWVKCINSYSHESRLLHDFVSTNFSSIPFFESTIHIHPAILFGPSASGLFVVDTGD